MGRSIPSITYRVDARLAEWERFGNMLPLRDKKSFQKLVSLVRDRRTAIDAADDDIDTAILLAIVVSLKTELDGSRPHHGGGADDERGLDSAQEPESRP